MNDNSESSQIPECVICQDIFYQPVTLPCGHSYCRPCIKEGLKNKPLCPTCRNPMIGNPDNLAINFTIQSIIETHHKQLYEQKKKSIEKKIVLDPASNPAQGSRILSGEARQNQQQKLENVLLLQQSQMKYLFPSTTVDVNLKHMGHFEQLLVQCSDRRVVIKLGNSNHNNAVYCQVVQVNNEDQNNVEAQKKDIKCEVKVIARVQITETKEVKINYSEAIQQPQVQEQPLQQPENIQNVNQDGQQQQQQQQQEQQNQTQTQNQRFEDGYTFTVVSGSFVEDSNHPSDQEVGIQEHTEGILAIIDEIIQNNGGVHMTTYQLQAFLQKQNFLPYLQNGYINNITKVDEFCWIVCGIFKFTNAERERLWEADSLIERLTLIKQYIVKFQHIKNITTIFDMHAPGSSDSLTYIIAGVFIIILLYKFLSEYFDWNTNNHPYFEKNQF